MKKWNRLIVNVIESLKEVFNCIVDDKYLLPFITWEGICCIIDGMLITMKSSGNAMIIMFNAANKPYIWKQFMTVKYNIIYLFSDGKVKWKKMDNRKSKCTLPSKSDVLSWGGMVVYIVGFGWLSEFQVPYYEHSR